MLFVYHSVFKGAVEPSLALIKISIIMIIIIIMIMRIILKYIIAIVIMIMIITIVIVTYYLAASALRGGLALRRPMSFGIASRAIYAQSP